MGLWASRGPPVSLFHLSLGILRLPLHAIPSALHVFWGSKRLSSCLSSKYVIHSAISPSQRDFKINKSYQCQIFPKGIQKVWWGLRFKSSVIEHFFRLLEVHGLISSIENRRGRERQKESVCGRNIITPYSTVFETTQYTVFIFKGTLLSMGQSNLSTVLGSQAISCPEQCVLFL